MTRPYALYIDGRLAAKFLTEQGAWKEARKRFNGHLIKVVKEQI